VADLLYLLESGAPDGYRKEQSSYAAIVRAHAPLAYWRLGESSGANANDEISTHDGTYKSGPTFGVAGALSGDRNTAIDTSGGAAWVDIAPTFVYPWAPLGNAARSLVAWVKTSSATQQEAIGYGVASSDQDFALSITSGGALAFFSHGPTHTFGGSVANGAFHMLALTYDGSTMRGYIDGAPVGTPYTPGTLHTADGNGFALGVWSGGLIGSLDEAAIYDRALTEAEIAAQYLAGSVPGSDDAGLLLLETSYASVILADTPAGYWRLDDVSGQFQDVSGHGHPTTSISGTPTYSQAGALAGDTDTAVSFAGGTDWGNILHHADFNVGNGPFSIEAWVYQTGGIWFFGKWDPADTGWAVGISPGVGLLGYNAGVNYWFDAAEAVPSLNAWHHIVFTKSGGTATAYVDGVAQTNTGTPSTVIADTGNSLAIGAAGNSTSNKFLGKLDEVAFYNYVLTPAQVAAHYVAGITHTDGMTAAGGVVSGDFSPDTFDPADFDTWSANASVSIKVNAGLGSGTGTAYNATVTTSGGTNAAAGNAAGTGAAFGASINVQPNASAATGTGVAGQAAANVAPNAGNAAGTGAAQNATKAVAASASAATGVGTANQPGASVAVPAGVATGTGAAFNATPNVGGGALTAAGTGTAFGATTKIVTNASAATGTGVANQASANVQPNAAAAAGTGAAFDATKSVAPGPTSATGTGSAGQASTSIKATAGVASGTGSAGQASANVAPNGGNAAGTGVAGAPTPSVAVNASAATGTGAAYDATVTTGSSTNATAQAATGTGSAGQATVTIAPNAGNTAGTGAAGAATTKIVTNATAAAGTGVAGQAAANVQPNATAATGTGSAANATKAVAPAAGTAAGTGTAGDATTKIVTNASTAAGTGAAFNATVSTSKSVSAGLASGTGAANGATASIAPSAGAAAGTGAANGPSGSIATRAGGAAALGAAFPASAWIVVAAGPGLGTGTAYNASTPFAITVPDDSYAIVESSAYRGLLTRTSSIATVEPDRELAEVT
jgi:Concanavalin A-like lectin/glucanases superfamily